MGNPGPGEKKSGKKESSPPNGQTVRAREIKGDNSKGAFFWLKLQSDIQK